MEPELMIAEVRLRSATVRGAETAAVQPLVRKNRVAVSALVVGTVSVLLLILAYLAIVIAIARMVPAAASG